MKVLHVSPAFFGANGYVGGGERYAHELARAVAVECPGTRLVSFGSDPREFAEGPLRVTILRPDGFADGHYLNPIAPALMSAVLEADLVHCHQCHTFLSNLVVLFAKAAGKVVVATDLGGGTRNYEAEIGQNDRIDEFHLLSEFSANAFRAWREKVRVVYGGFSERVVCGDSSRERRGVVYVGRFLPHKGVDYLIEAVGADTELHLLGRPLDDGFFARLLRLSLGKRVIFHLEAEDAEVAEAYAGAVAAVLPSVYKDSAGRLAENAELLGLAAIEAMANATPVVVTRVASLPELVTDGETGFVVPPNDPAALGERIAWLLERPREARRMGRAARARARERFTWTAVARACVERYRALFDRAAS